MIKYLRKNQALTFANVTGAAVRLAQQAGGTAWGTDTFFFWTNEWRVFLALACKAKIEVQR